MRQSIMWILYAGVLANEVDLVNYFDNYIMQPVLFKALPGSSDPQDDHNPSRFVHSLESCQTAGLKSIIALLNLLHVCQ